MKSKKVVALLSGGKDSLFNMYLATREGHDVVAIANLKPPEGSSDELDSYMYQTVGHQAIELVAQALDKPLYRAVITGKPTVTDLNYESSQNKNEDEVEQLFQLLHDIRHKHKIDFNAVSVGAIASSYQKSRVEDICRRLDIDMLAYMWGQDQHSLLQQMIDAGFNAILIKVACLGLSDKHIGKTLKEMQTELRTLHEEYKTNVCGEGGEFESLVLDCPLYKKRLILDSYEVICHSNDVFAPVYYIKPTKMHLEDK